MTESSWRWIAIFELVRKELGLSARRLFAKLSCNSPTNPIVDGSKTGSALDLRFVINSAHKRQIITAPNQDSSTIRGFQPILGNEIWEPVDYLKYQNRRVDYLLELVECGELGKWNRALRPFIQKYSPESNCTNGLALVANCQTAQLKNCAVRSTNLNSIP